MKSIDLFTRVRHQLSLWGSFRKATSRMTALALWLLMVRVAQAATPQMVLCQKATIRGNQLQYQNPTYFGVAGSALTIAGYGFGGSTVVDIYFDNTEIEPAVTNASGIFILPTQIPATALVGQHWITAIQRSNDSAAQSPFQVESNWAASRYSAVQKANNYYENILSPSTVGNIDLAWSFATGGAVYSSPAQLDTATINTKTGVVTQSYDLYVGSSINSIYDIDGVSGTVKWQFLTSGAASTPVVSNGVVYVGSSDYSIYAINAVTGMEIWNFSTLGPIVSPPQVVNGVVYFGSLDHNLYALNASTGALIWSFNADGPINTSPAVYGGAIYVASEAGTFYAINAASGTTLWSVNFLDSCNQDTPSAATVADGVVYIQFSNSIYAFSANTGYLISQAQFSANSCSIGSSPAIANGILYVGSDDRNLYALDLRTGYLLWNYSTGAPIDSSPAVADGVVYIGSEDFNVYALDANTGAVLWNFPTGNEVESSPTIANGTLYVGSDDGNLYAFNLAGGSQTRRGAPRPDPKKLHPDLTLQVHTVVSQASLSH